MKETAPVPTIILCGGRGTRMGNTTHALPKPMVAIGDRPVLWHIMKLYAAQGHNDFVLALGWLGDEIRKFFLTYEGLTRDFTIELGRPSRVTYLDEHPDDGWRVTCLDTGRDAMTGTRVRRAADALGGGPLMVTYGDGVGDIDINALLAFHRAQGRLATVTVVHPPGRFGEIKMDGTAVLEFEEKPQTSTGAISGGFMVLEREAVDRYIPAAQDVMLEREPFAALAKDGQLSAYVHEGFWLPMDTPRERDLLESMWQSDAAPWKVWK